MKLFTVICKHSLTNAFEIKFKKIKINTTCNKQVIALPACY